MSIELHGTSGVIIFFTIVIFFQFFFGLIGGLFSNLIGLTGLSYWIMTIGIILIADAIFININ